MKKLLFISLLFITASCDYDYDYDIFINNGNINTQLNDSTRNEKPNTDNQGTISFGVSDVEEG